MNGPAEVVPFDELYEKRTDACVAGLERGMRWVDARLDHGRVAESMNPSRHFPAARVPESISHLVIVSRDRPEVFERLHARFTDTAGMIVIFDRRKILQPVPVEHRLARPSRTARLVTDGFLVVPME